MFIKRLLAVVVVVEGLVCVTSLDASQVLVQIESFICDPYWEGSKPEPAFTLVPVAATFWLLMIWRLRRARD